MSTKLASPERGSPKPSWLGAQHQLAFASRQLSWFKLQEGARGLFRRLMLRPGRFVHRRSPLLRAFLLPVVILLAAALLESWLHRRRFVVPMPTYELDAPFYTACQEPDVDEPRENAALVMLARNSELAAAQHTIQSIERQFNRWFHYPVIFLNDEEWSAEFIATMNATVSGGAQFHVVPQSDWTFPSWLDQDAAKASIAQQAKDGILYAGLETYHHMCRFFSGKFYKLDALRNYKWYWRLEPDVDFHCAITYDPFVEMAKNNKMYGYTIALNEVRNTCPSLFRKIADWKEEHRIGTSSLWKATVMASWLPWPFRTWLRWLPHRDRFGDMWSSCHYWSNFEIADLDFFRSKEYQDLFEYLDKDGGFYYERWGDAAVHSLALHMLADPRRLHHFADIGYRHDTFFQCPTNAPNGQLPESETLGKYQTPWAPEREGGIGCRCECDGGKPHNYNAYCLARLKEPNSMHRPGMFADFFAWFM